MPNESAAKIRRRAEQAHRLSEAIHNLEAKRELRQLADRMSAEADRLEQDQKEASILVPESGSTDVEKE